MRLTSERQFTPSMIQSSRRNFLSFVGKAAAFTGLASIGGCAATAATPAPAKNGFIHHVYFWLNKPDSTQDRARLIEGLQKLASIKIIKEYHIGLPADTNREVIDRSYAVSWMLLFKDKADQDSYQADPIHLKFVEDYSNLWSRVVVYDSVSV